MKNTINVEEILPFIIHYLDRAITWEERIDTFDNNDEGIYYEYIYEEVTKAETLLYLIVSLCYDDKEETITYKGVTVNKQLYLDYISYFTPENNK